MHGATIRFTTNSVCLEHVKESVTKKTDWTCAIHHGTESADKREIHTKITIPALRYPVNPLLEVKKILKLENTLFKTFPWLHHAQQ